jgi:plasmid stabilization system protein ParE
MNLPVLYLPEADDDIFAAFCWYEDQRAGLGEEFLQSLDEVLDRVADNAKLCGVVRKGVRAAPLRPFPYVVFYRERDDDVLIIAVQDGRRSVRAWRNRV